MIPKGARQRLKQNILDAQERRLRTKTTSDMRLPAALPVQCLICGTKEMAKLSSKEELREHRGWAGV
jgi:hypothetical protein